MSVSEIESERGLNTTGTTFNVILSQNVRKYNIIVRKSYVRLYCKMTRVAKLISVASLILAAILAERVRRSGAKKPTPRALHMARASKFKNYTRV